MPVYHPIKEVLPAQINQNGEASVHLSFTAAPGLLNDPAEIVLVLDRSGNMNDARMAQMKNALSALTDLVSHASGGNGTVFSGGTRMGLVSFSTDAAVDAALTSSVSDICLGSDQYCGHGAPAHAQAIRTASTLFTRGAVCRQIMVIFTAGGATLGTAAVSAAQAASDSGIELFCIGLSANQAILRNWASSPCDRHVFQTSDPAMLEQLFLAVGDEIIHPGAADASIREVLSDDFEIVKIIPPEIGSVRQIDRRSLQWDIGTVGRVSIEEIELCFVVRYTGCKCGTWKVNHSITYRDRDCSSLQFPEPVLTVSCGGCVDPVIVPEPCPVPISFTIGSCHDSSVVDLRDTDLVSLGRVVQLNATLKSVCPDKRVALAVLLTEVDADGNEHSRGMKTLTIPAHNSESCQDVQIKCIRFVIPEDLDVSGTRSGTLCNSRNFKARVMANYIDTDFACCDPSSTIL